VIVLAAIEEAELAAGTAARDRGAAGRGLRGGAVDVGLLEGAAVRASQSIVAPMLSGRIDASAVTSACHGGTRTAPASWSEARASA
jgi:hypothetical protein